MDQRIPDSRKNRRDLRRLFEAGAEKFLSLPVLREVEGKTVIVGDIHSSAHAAFRLLLQHKALASEEMSFIFLGDYMDRGSLD